MTEAVKGFIKPNTSGSPLNTLDFFIRQKVLNLVDTAFLAVVKSVDEEQKTVDVLPLVQSVDGNGNAVRQSQVFNLPYGRIQAGSRAVLVTPESGDIGVVIVCKDDGAAVLASRSEAVPPSNKKYNRSNGIYLCSIAATAAQPESFLEISGGETPVITVQTGGNVIVNASDVTATASGTATIKATTANIEAVAVNLGGDGGQPVARVGDTVLVGGVTGTIQSGSAKVKAL